MNCTILLSTLNQGKCRKKLKLVSVAVVTTTTTATTIWMVRRLENQGRSTSVCLFLLLDEYVCVDVLIIVLEVNHEAQRLPQLQQQQQLQEPHTRRESSPHVHQSQNYREQEADNDHSGYQDYDDRPIGRRKKRSQVEK